MDILQTIIQGITVIITNALTIGATPIGDRIIAVMTGRENSTAMGTAAAGTPITEARSTKAAVPIGVTADEVVRIRKSLQVGHARQYPGASDQKG
jgi:hypothetical protein